MSALLSVVVPFFNVESYLARCLDSLANQSYRDLDIVLVDDGSVDASVQIAQWYCDHDPRFSLVRQDNQGLGPARNTGVRHATGDLLAFADSDDLVPHHAYELLVTSLNQTGSDLAAGDARRFTRLWVRDSYAHRRPFAKTLLRTHVRDSPLLATDRMAWNKVYRREHWERNALEFPAMLYEDYPVTVKAHVTATAVDVLEHPVYYWREREGGEPSITQSKWRLPNLQDRVRSAEMVLDYLDGAAPEVLPKVYDHFLDVDLDAIVGAIHEADSAEVAQIVGLARRLLHRIPPDQVARATPYRRVQAALLDHDDPGPLKALLDYRNEHGTHAAAVMKGRFRKQRYLALPFFDDQAVTVPDSCYEVPTSALSVRTAVIDGRWDGGDLLTRGIAFIRDVPLTAASSMQIWVRDRAGHRIDLPVRRYWTEVSGEEAQLAGFVTRLNPHLLSALGKGTGKWSYRIAIVQDELKVKGLIRLGPSTRARWAPQEALSGNAWAQPQSLSGGVLGVVVRDGRQIVDNCLAVQDTLVVRGRYSAVELDESPVLELTRHDCVTLEVPGHAWVVDGRSHQFEFVLRLDELGFSGARFDPMEEPVTWIARIVLSGRRKILATAAGFTGDYVRLDGSQVRLTRSHWGNLLLQHGPPGAFIDYIDWHDDNEVTVSGQLGTHEGEVTLQLHRYITPELPVVTQSPMRTHQGRFWARFAIADLVAAAEQAESAARQPKHPTPWHLAVASATGRSKLPMPRDLLWTLPEPRVVDEHDVVFEIVRGDAITVMVRGRGHRSFAFDAGSAAARAQSAPDGAHHATRIADGAESTDLPADSVGA